MSEEDKNEEVKEYNVLFESKDDLVAFLGEELEGWTTTKNSLPTWPLLTGKMLPSLVSVVSSRKGVKVVEENQEMSIPEENIGEEDDPESSEGGFEGPEIQI